MELVQGNNSIVNRSGTQFTRLILRINDTITNAIVINGTNGTVFVTTNGASFDSGTNNRTNETGHLTIFFNPTSSYAVGPQIWKGGTKSDVGYFDTNSTLFNLTIFGYLTNSLVSPSSGSEFLRGENVTFVAHVDDDLSVAVDNATVNISMINENRYGFQCGLVEPQGGGDYRCVINTSNPTILPARWYNVSTMSNKTFYNNGSNLTLNRLFIKPKPVLTHENATSQQGGTTGGWGEVWKFNITVTDEDLDNVTVQLMIKKATDPDSSYITANTSSYTTN